MTRRRWTPEDTARELSKARDEIDGPFMCGALYEEGSWPTHLAKRAGRCLEWVRR